MSLFIRKQQFPNRTSLKYPYKKKTIIKSKLIPEIKRNIYFCLH